MKRAILSDIHSNLEAIEAVLADVRQQGVDEIFCLGDIIGYGPNPNECVDIVCQFALTVLGNHDQAVMFDPEGFNPVALQAVYWTRDMLENGPGGFKEINRRWDFLGELPRQYADGPFLFVHGSPREPTNEYVFPEDKYNRRKIEILFNRVEQYCFQGHTHIPGVFTESGEFKRPDELDHFTYPLGEQKIMVNVGSVGQPRDGDRRASYIILTDEKVEFRRVDYPVEKTRDKIIAIPELDGMLGDRLLEGR